MRAPCKVGISLASAYPVSDPRQRARWMVERTQAAHAAGDSRHTP